MPPPTPAADKAAFEATHVYSAAPEAGPKRRIDEALMGGDFAKRAKIDMNDEAYLKQLVYLATGGRRVVATGGKGLQFYMIKGGGEGFLDPSYSGKDASRVIIGGGVTTSGAAGTMMIFDNNDLLAVFDRNGKLLGSALLERPVSITNPNIWTEHTANRIYDAWDGQPVTLYRNRNFDIVYYGLMIHDKLGWYAQRKVMVDLHKQEATNGCIFIVDPATPPLSDEARLNIFEPQLIKDIQTHIGAREKRNIGTMHVIEIK
ncbi:MAG: hypothetical protein ACREE7_08605 [Dongiaceae bacterium]